ncbi:MAG: type II toxin-antitoxin system death-on-curing family toxin [Lysobacterales bacterium]|nr:MAG: type II toxin-antitoxin system death-on-curing family toxin [Xanthomonadales bacterium]
MPDWLGAHDINYFHRELLKEHGGLPGLKDEGALESTLARPRNLLADTPDASMAQLAASYGFGFAKNHVFADGNKRIALAAINVFLQINGANLDVEEAEAVIVMNDVAAGRIDEDSLAAWISQRAVPFDLDAD